MFSAEFLKPEADIALFLDPTMIIEDQHGWPRVAGSINETFGADLSVADAKKLRGCLHLSTYDALQGRHSRNQSESRPAKAKSGFY